MNRLAVMLGSLLLTACVSVGPDYQPQESFEPEHLNSEHSVQFSKRSETWWLQFKDPVLQQLIEAALNNNYTIKQAEANVNAAFAQFRRAKSDQWPSGGPSFNYSDAQRVIPGFSDGRVDITSYQLGVDALWNFDLFGKLRRAREAALANAEATELQWLDVQAGILAQVALNYAEYNGALARVDVAQRSIASMQEMRRIVADRLELGFATELDLARIDADLFGVKSTVPSLQASARRYKNTLAALVGGQAVLAPIVTDGDSFHLPDLNQPLAIGEPKAILRQRADIFVAERQLAAATANIGVQTANLYPDLSVTGFLGFLSNDFSSLGDDISDAWSIAPSLSWSIFNVKGLLASVDVANQQQQAALANFQQIVLNALAEADTALSDYAKLQVQSHLLQAQVEASQKALSLARVQYDLGAIDLFQVLDTERNALTAEDNLLQAQFRTFSAVVQVYTAFGSGFVAEERIEK